MTPAQIVNELLEGEGWVRQILGEASVHLPRRGHIWISSFTGVRGQEWKSTGTSDKPAALAIAQEFEDAARAQRAKSGGAGENRTIRIRVSPGGTGGGLTQREVALVMKLSERAVRAIEKRALRKLAQHPQLREIWRQYLAGELAEHEQRLSAPEIQAVLGLARSQAELETILRVLAIVQG